MPPHKDNFTFEHSWTNVTLANWLKYPSKFTPHVVNVDYLERRVNPHTGELVTERILTVSMQQSIPKIFQMFFPSEVGYVHEVSTIDPKNKTLTTESKNLSFDSIFCVTEKCVYETHPNDEQKTLLSQEADIDFRGLKLLKNSIEEFCAGRFIANAAKGRAALEQVLQKIKESEMAASSFIYN